MKSEAIKYECQDEEQALAHLSVELEILKKGNLKGLGPTPTDRSATNNLEPSPGLVQAPYPELPEEIDPSVAIAIRQEFVAMPYCLPMKDETFEHLLGHDGKREQGE